VFQSATILDTRFALDHEACDVIVDDLGREVSFSVVVDRTLRKITADLSVFIDVDSIQ